MTGRRRLLVSCLATAGLLAPLAWMWQESLLPAQYSVMDMGHLDYGGGLRSSHASGQGVHEAHRDDVSITTFTADPDRAADVSAHLVARAQEFELASGRQVAGYTLNGTSPGPLIRAVQGDLVEVRLVNESVPEGVTLHWHGVDVPNSVDGVAGVTQDAVPEGGSHTYRFVAEDAGTYWYHSHQVSHEQVKRGLFGGLVVSPTNQDSDLDEEALDVSALVHIYDGVRTINGEEGDLAVDAAPGAKVRVRVANTDNAPMSAWVGGAPYRVRAVDGTDLNEPPPVSDEAVLLTGGARVDLEVVMPESGSGVRVEMGGSAALVLGSSASDVPETTRPTEHVDLLDYGRPAPIGFDPDVATRSFEYVVGRRPGFLDGRPGLWWTVNGSLYPDMPMFVVAEGDIVRVRLENRSAEVHPMHLHGHHMVVLSRDGVASTGSPWWVDSLNVGIDETYEVAFVADNPGIWMDHCHNLEHAADGMVTHLMYAGVSTPYLVGGSARNEPE